MALKVIAQSNKIQITDRIQDPNSVYDFYSVAIDMGAGFVSVSGIDIRFNYRPVEKPWHIFAAVSGYRVWVNDFATVEELIAELETRMRL